MSELAPGLYITETATQGSIAVIDLAQLTGIAGARGLVIHPADWDRIPGRYQEQLIDLMTRETAEAGLAALEAWLAGPPGASYTPDSGHFPPS